MTFPIKNETELGFTKWLEIDQDMINKFADATLDQDPMHVDEQWAKNESPFGRTLVFGFQTISLLTYFSHNIFKAWEEMCPDLKYALNYGFDHLRLTAPVPVGSKIRAKFKLVSSETKKNGNILLKINAVIENQGEEKPAMVADWLFMVYPRASK